MDTEQYIYIAGLLHSQTPRNCNYLQKNYTTSTQSTYSMEGWGLVIPTLTLELITADCFWSGREVSVL